MAKLRAQMDEEIDLVRMFNFTTFAIMSELAFGASLNMLAQDNYCPWVEVIFGFVKIDARMNAIGQLMPLVHTLLRCFFGRYIGRMKSDHFRFVEERIGDRLKAGSDKADIWNLLLKPQEHSERLTRDEMNPNASVFMVAGTEAVATALSGLTYLLLKNPATLIRLTNEVRGAFRKAD
jgi:cytochrome P450